ncbi:hypothetical protein GGX14DRAFT_403339 [Mycena pura]|uniref:Uncharacterized protein n=1 Tax=Mycena pura TaxID=153505 RepID=A0AAD6V028_9AGAR|nr:hypothetical protein GGX14DRAFT_403339 [Mycena pura]
MSVELCPGYAHFRASQAYTVITTTGGHTRGGVRAVTKLPTTEEEGELGRREAQIQGQRGGAHLIQLSPTGMAGGGDPCTRLTPAGKFHGYSYPLAGAGSCAGNGWHRGVSSGSGAAVRRKQGGEGGVHRQQCHREACLTNKEGGSKNVRNAEATSPCGLEGHVHPKSSSQYFDRLFTACHPSPQKYTGFGLQNLMDHVTDFQKFIWRNQHTNTRAVLLSSAERRSSVLTRWFYASSRRVPALKISKFVFLPFGGPGKKGVHPPDVTVTEPNSFISQASVTYHVNKWSKYYSICQS